MKTIIDSTGGGEEKLKAMRRTEERRLVAANSWPDAPSPPSRQRHAPHPPGESPSRTSSTANSEPAS